MQFEVAQARMATEFNAPVKLDRLDYSVARRTRPEDVVELNSLRGVEVLQRTDGELLALFPDKWRAGAVERNQPELMLEPLVAGER
jgi:peptide chain release factor 3